MPPFGRQSLWEYPVTEVSFQWAGGHSECLPPVAQFSVSPNTACDSPPSQRVAAVLSQTTLVRTTRLERSGNGRSICADMGGAQTCKPSPRISLVRSSRSKGIKAVFEGCNALGTKPSIGNCPDR